MDMDHLMFSTLKELAKDDFDTFKWFLKKEQVGGLPGIPQSDLEGANRTQTADLIKQHYPGKETDIMVYNLKKVDRNDLAESFGNKSKELERCRDVVRRQQSSELQSSTSTGSTGTKREKEEHLREFYKTTLKGLGSFVGGAKGGRGGAERGGKVGEKAGDGLTDVVVNVVRMLESDEDD